MKNSIKTYRCSKDSNIEKGDFVAIDRGGVIYKPTVDDCRNRTYCELYRYVCTEAMESKQ